MRGCEEVEGPVGIGGRGPLRPSCSPKGVGAPSEAARKPSDGAFGFKALARVV